MIPINKLKDTVSYLASLLTEDCEKNTRILTPTLVNSEAPKHSHVMCAQDYTLKYEFLLSWWRLIYLSHCMVSTWCIRGAPQPSCLNPLLQSAEAGRFSVLRAQILTDRLKSHTHTPARRHTSFRYKIDRLFHSNFPCKRHRSFIIEMLKEDEERLLQSRPRCLWLRN